MKFILFAGFAATFLCLSVTAIDHLRVVNVTSSTCSLFWRKPTSNEGMYKYVIATYDNGTEYIVESYYCSYQEIEFTVIDLHPATIYNISVDIVYAGVKLSTECLTKPEIEVAVQPVRQLESLDSTNTTCRISWKKPTKDNKPTRYVISAYDYQSSYTSYRYLSTLSDNQYTVEDLLPGTEYKISVYVDYKDNEVTTSCITKPQLGKLHLLDVTNSSCSVFWKKPVDNDNTLKYVISFIEKESVDPNNTLYSRYFNFIPELLYTFINLQPATKYNISVYDNYSNKKMSTECLTKPDLDQLKVLDVTNTTCTLYWKRPIDSDEIIRYYITSENGKNFMSYRIFTSFPEVTFVFKKLEPDTTYVMSVYIAKVKKTLASKCTTTPALDKSEKSLEKYAYKTS
ncbi:tenascin-like [Leptopilina heterotoma]|uniref:tenascin-like n=1 Tax=Leptopilina heterotoma TaxID=63436 RepID=UPI001CA80171|nr:tenascin-like [Leptopilina heterotoma]